MAVQLSPNVLHCVSFFIGSLSCLSTTRMLCCTTLRRNCWLSSCQHSRKAQARAWLHALKQPRGASSHAARRASCCCAVMGTKEWSRKGSGRRTMSLREQQIESSNSLRSDSDRSEIHFRFVGGVVGSLALAGAFSGVRGMALYSAILHHACANRPPPA